MSTTRRLYRSSTDQKFAGVCAGLADYLDTDPTVIRVVYLLLTFFTGVFPGIILYIILAIIMPEAPTPAPKEPDEFD
jgi:phage shock protein C